MYLAWPLSQRLLSLSLSPLSLRAAIVVPGGCARVVRRMPGDRYGSAGEGSNKLEPREGDVASLKEVGPCVHVMLELRADGGGAVVDVEIIVREGRFHQVRRLVKRAGLRMRHLRRVAVGSVATRGVEVPGQWRSLDDDEMAELTRGGSNEPCG